MKRPGLPLFLQRRPYRRRRKIDAARLLPVFGAFLLLLPMLWAPPEGQGRGTVSDGLFLFLVFAGLIAVTSLMAPSLTAEEHRDPDGGDG